MAASHSFTTATSAAASSSSSSSSASPSSSVSLPYIPFVYRLLLLYLEPVMAINGAAMCMMRPALFLKTFSPVLPYTASSQIIYDQLAATYLFLALIEAVVLRASAELRVWKAVVASLLVSDFVHLWAGAKLMAQEGNVWPVAWRPEDWIVLGTLVGPGLLRLAFLWELGFTRSKLGARA